MSPAAGRPPAGPRAGPSPRLANDVACFSWLPRCRGVDAKFLQAIAQGVAAQAEQPRGAGLAAAALAQGLQQQRSLEVLEQQSAVGDLDVDAPAPVAVRLRRPRR